MRNLFLLLILGACLLTGGCGDSKGVQSPPALNQDLIIGKWEAEEPDQFIQAFEFNNDKSARMTIWQVKEPVKATYSWSGSNTVLVEYQASDEDRKGYRAGVEAMKAKRLKAAEQAGGGGPIANGLKRSIDQFNAELPAREEFRVGASAGQHPTLVLSSEKHLSFSFRRPK